MSCQYFLEVHYD